MRLCIVLILGLLNGAAEASVKITRTEPTTERRRFDPAHPPADMPKLHGNEAAVAVSFYGADSRVGGQVIGRQTSDGSATASIKVDTVEMTLKLNVVIWLPLHANEKLIHHEEGHRKIAEDYYRDADRLARQQAESLIGQIVTGSGNDVDSAGDAALKAAAQNLGWKYLSRTDTPCSGAQERYDAITEHGTNAVPEAEAIRQAETP